MGYSFIEQCICTNGHYYTVWGNECSHPENDDYRCEQCDQMPVWTNHFETTCDPITGKVQLSVDDNHKVVSMPNPDQGQWHNPSHDWTD